MNKIIVRSRDATERMRPYPVPWACISISSPGQPDAQIKPMNCVGLLRLQFDDLARGTMFTHYDTLFTTEHARRILDFAREIWAAADILHVHCEAGISRSPATAAALARIYFGDDREFFVPPFRPNRLVYPTILNVHRSAWSDERLFANLVNAGPAVFACPILANSALF